MPPSAAAAGAAGRAGQRVREQPRLGQDQHGGDQARRDGEDQVPPGGRGVPEQPRIDRSHKPVAPLISTEKV